MYYYLFSVSSSSNYGINIDDVISFVASSDIDNINIVKSFIEKNFSILYFSEVNSDNINNGSWVGYNCQFNISDRDNNISYFKKKKNTKGSSDVGFGFIQSELSFFNTNLINNSNYDVKIKNISEKYKTIYVGSIDSVFLIKRHKNVAYIMSVTRPLAVGSWLMQVSFLKVKLD